MNIFNNLRQYQKPPRKVQPPTEEELRQKEERIKREKKEHIKEYIKGLLSIILFLTFLGCLWWFAELKFVGTILFFCLSIFTFAIISPTFATIPFEKLWGEKIGTSIGCVGMALGPLLGFWLFISSAPYWDLKERAEIEDSPKVYITPHGECYHSTEDCYTIRGHKIKEIPLYKAEKKGRRPCDICY